MIHALHIQNLSNCCWRQHEQSISRIFQSYFWRVFAFWSSWAVLRKEHKQSGFSYMSFVAAVITLVLNINNNINANNNNLNRINLNYGSSKNTLTSLNQNVGNNFNIMLPPGKKKKRKRRRRKKRSINIENLEDLLLELALLGTKYVQRKISGEINRLFTT